MALGLVALVTVALVTVALVTVATLATVALVTAALVTVALGFVASVTAALVTVALGLVALVTVALRFGAGRRRAGHGHGPLGLVASVTAATAGCLKGRSGHSRAVALDAVALGVALHFARSGRCAPVLMSRQARTASLGMPINDPVY